MASPRTKGLVPTSAAHHHIRESPRGKMVDGDRHHEVTVSKRCKELSGNEDRLERHSRKLEAKKRCSCKAKLSRQEEIQHCFTGPLLKAAAVIAGVGTSSRRSGCWHSPGIMSAMFSAQLCGNLFCYLLSLPQASQECRKG